MQLPEPPPGLTRMVCKGDVIAFKRGAHGVAPGTRYLILEVKDDGLVWMQRQDRPEEKPTCFIARFSDGSLNCEFEIVEKP